VSEQKTEKPTPKKIKEARKEGQVARTPELGAWAAMLALGFLLHMLVVRAFDSMELLMLRAMALVDKPTTARALKLFHDGGVTALIISVVLGSGVLFVGIAAGAAQGGIHLASKSAKPKFSRLNPIAGAKRLFGPHALWEGAKVTIKASVVALLVWRTVKGLMPLLGGLIPLSVGVQIVAAQATLLIRDVAIAGLVMAAADYAMKRRQIGKQTKMTKNEVKQEHKQSEGDPLIKNAIRSRQLAAARNRMMADVPLADVILTNPTHVAVALSYDPQKGAPRVLALGAGAIAARIRERATEARVPMVEDVPLARALYSSCKVGQEIPAELYGAVAQVLAFVISRRRQGVSGGRHSSPRTETVVPKVPRSRRRRRKPGDTNPSSPEPESR
jgi:flagellar biosynthetic protein FlhB